MNLTRRQRDILDFVIDFKHLNRIAPTLAEIAGNFGITKETAHSHLQQLERKGAIRRNRHESRGIVILVDDEEGQRNALPMRGYISAGQPIEALLTDEMLDMGSFFPARRDCFVLRVRGDSMIDEGILDGDYVVVQRRSNPEDGDTVVALVNGNEATLKKFYREKNGIRLQPANKKLKPLYPTEVSIQGIVIRVLRRC